MTYQEIQDRIVTNFWSEGLKRQLAQTGHRFSEQDLLGLAFRYAVSFDERLQLLELLVEHVPSVTDQARRAIDWQRESLTKFQQHGDHEVYELTIKTTPESYAERYLCADYGTCLELIDKFYEEYGHDEDDAQARYRITKRRILQRGGRFQEDELGECVLLPGKLLLSVDVYDDRTEVCGPGHDCMNCKTPSAHCIEICFPAFLPDRSAVRYRMPDGSIRFGVHLGSNQDSECCYVIPLDGEMLRSRDHAAHWDDHWHEHIPHPDVDAAAREELPEDLQENLDAFLTFLETAGIE